MMDAGILEAISSSSKNPRRPSVVMSSWPSSMGIHAEAPRHEKGQFVLKPENKAYPVIRPEGALEIFGVMVGLVRKI